MQGYRNEYGWEQKTLKQDEFMFWNSHKMSAYSLLLCILDLGYTEHVSELQHENLNINEYVEVFFPLLSAVTC
jgi:hypothetical protein